MSIRVARNQDRKSKRLKVRFGVDDLNRMAFLGNASAEGAWIVTGQPEPVGTLLRICIYLPDGEEILMQGRVKWAKKIPPNLVRLSKNAGMGVEFTRFDSGFARFTEYLATLRF